MGNNSGPDHNQTPASAETFGQDNVVPFEQATGEPNVSRTIEDYFLDKLGDAFEEDELNETVNGLVEEARGSQELAELLAEREMLLIKSRHPSQTGRSSQIQARLKELNGQIVPLKDRLGSQTETS